MIYNVPSFNLIMNYYLIGSLNIDLITLKSNIDFNLKM